MFTSCRGLGGEMMRQGGSRFEMTSKAERILQRLLSKLRFALQKINPLVRRRANMAFKSGDLNERSTL
jgi:hypothetical protein